MTGLALSSHHEAFGGLSFRSVRAALSASFVSAAATIPPSRGGMSSGTYSSIISGRRCDPHAIRRKYPDRWRDFLRANFRSSEEVLFVFGCDPDTVLNWWHGRSTPQAWAVEVAIKTIPAAAEWLEAA